MANKNVTLRLPEDMVIYLQGKSDSINQAVISEISFLRRIRQVSLGEIKGLFTKEEWLFMLDAFNGTLIDEVFCANKGAFIAGCEDAERFDGAANKHGVNLKDFIDKCSVLRGANIEAIYSRISEYWIHCADIDLNEWADF